VSEAFAACEVARVQPGRKRRQAQAKGVDQGFVAFACPRLTTTGHHPCPNSDLTGEVDPDPKLVFVVFLRTVASDNARLRDFSAKMG